jgi:putative DNA methylase
MTSDTRLIEAGFPCHQVGAETQRERGASSALPPLYFLHVWWARRPLTPSRAAIVASLSPSDTDPETFVRELGIERKVVYFGDRYWVLTGSLLNKVEGVVGCEYLPVDAPVLRAFDKEQERRQSARQTAAQLRSASSELAHHPVLQRWESECLPLPEGRFGIGDKLPVSRMMGDPAHVSERIEFAKSAEVKQILGSDLRWDSENLYGYGRAFANDHAPKSSNLVVLDPTSGGGSIPFEALRLGHKVIANELNPVATTILHATLDFPARFGSDLKDDIESWGNKLIRKVEADMAPYVAFSEIPSSERLRLDAHLKKSPELVGDFLQEYDYTGFLYTRQVTCPHCRGEAPLMNTFWLSKEASDPWGVKVITEGAAKGGKVSFETYQVKSGRGPNGENPEQSSVSDGVGQCVHCKQAIDGDEIKAQARGESEFGKWQNRLYAVVAVRYQPKLDKNGNIQRFSTGERAGQIKTEKIRYFRPPNTHDLDALQQAELRLQKKWPQWEQDDLIPTESFPAGNDMRPVIYGMQRWCDMFTPRQLLGHLSLVEELNNLKPRILEELGHDRGKAVVTYLQFVIDKGVDYNCSLNTWENSRGVVKHIFSKHDYSLKWTFSEMIFSGPASGIAWALSQILDAYEGLSDLLEPLNEATNGTPPVKIINGSASSISDVHDGTVDLVCMDPPYYNNVQYAELSDYFYVWQKRTLKTLYPELFSRRITNKTDEAVANPARDGSAKNAKQAYEKLMADIFLECRRVLKDDGVMTLMFTHKQQEAWETLTRSLIESGWEITSSFPVESEGQNSTHQMNMAAAASSIFITCRKRPLEDRLPSTWTGIGGTGVAAKVRDAVGQALRDFAPLRLNPVDRMVASYGRALQVLSNAWPVVDGDEPVGPIRAMNEAARVVSAQEISRITLGRLSVDDLDPESAMALTLFGIFGLGAFAFDEANNVAKSLNIRLEAKAAGYRLETGERLISYNQEATGRRGQQQAAEDVGYHAPLLRKGSKLRLCLPEERSVKRLEKPQSLWDVMQGALVKYAQGDTPVARAYLETHAKEQVERIVDLLEVWALECGNRELKKAADGLLFGLRLQNRA